MERHVRFVPKLGGLVSRLQMNLLGPYFILGYFRNPEQLVAPWWLLSVFSYTAQNQNLTQEYSTTVLKPCVLSSAHWSFGMIHLLFNDMSSEAACQPLSLAVMNTKGGLWEDAVQLYLQAWHSISPGLWLHAALHHSPPAVPLSWS